MIERVFYAVTWTIGLIGAPLVFLVYLLDWTK